MVRSVGWCWLLFAAWAAALLAGTLPLALLGWIPLWVVGPTASCPALARLWPWRVGLQGLFRLLTPYLWAQASRTTNATRLVLFLDSVQRSPRRVVHLLAEPR